MNSKTIALTAAAAMALTACSKDPYTGESKISNLGLGSLLGSAAGAGAGAIIGATTGVKTRTAVLVGAGVGALAGAGVGVYMDRQEEKLRKRLERTGVSVTRAGDDIILNMPGNVTFDFNHAEIKPQFYDVLNSVTLVLKEFDKTLIDVDGHTDNVGSDEANFDLSRRRATSVADYFSAQSIDPRRIEVHGYGKTRPIVSNASEQGRAQNRRVEIRLVPLRTG